MYGKYGYSFNGEHYVGAFADRDAAAAAGVEAARREAVQPATVFVARVIPADPKASGHARAVLSNMAARVREEVGSPGAGYLTKLDKAHVEDLDRALENTVLGWLTRHHLMPTFFRVESVSEHTVPAPSKRGGAGADDEVHDLGVSDAAEVSI